MIGLRPSCILKFFQYAISTWSIFCENHDSQTELIAICLLQSTESIEMLVVEPLTLKKTLLKSANNED